MRRSLIALLLCALLLCGCAPKQSSENKTDAYSFSDDTGVSLCVPYQPAKVAVLTSSLADLWCTAGGRVDITVGETVERGLAEDGVILVDEAAGKTVNLELLIASKPDFVLYSSELSGQLECADALSQAGIPAAGFRVDTFEEYLKVLKICTDILRTPDAYKTHGLELQEKVDSLIELAQSQPQQRSILFVRAGSSAKYTKAKTAENHFVCIMLQNLGTQNIAEDAPILLDGLSTEQILICDPDAILFTTMGDEAAGTAYMESLISDPVWQTLTAVKAGRIHQLPKDLFQYKPNARWDEAYTYLIRLLYGEIV